MQLTTHPCGRFADALLAVALLVALAVRAGGDEPQAEALGKTVGEPIDSGFVFVDGKYLDAPYRVTRDGLGVYINETVVCEPAKWPPRDLMVKEDPGQPVGLTENDTLMALARGEDSADWHWSRKYRYVHQHFPPEVAVEKMREYYSRLPFVRQVTLEDLVFLRVEEKSGKRTLIDVGPPRPDSVILKPPELKDVVHEIEVERVRLEQRLAAGDTFFLFSKGGELSFGKRKTLMRLPDMIEVLRSQRAKSEKVRELVRLGLFTPERTDFVTIVDQFAGTAQLDTRLKLLLEQRAIKPEITEEEEAEAERRAMMKYWEEEERKKAAQPK